MVGRHVAVAPAAAAAAAAVAAVAAACSVYDLARLRQRGWKSTLEPISSSFREFSAGTIVVSAHGVFIPRIFRGHDGW